MVVVVWCKLSLFVVRRCCSLFWCGCLFPFLQLLNVVAWRLLLLFFVVVYGLMMLFVVSVLCFVLFFVVGRWYRRYALFVVECYLLLIVLGL